MENRNFKFLELTMAVILGALLVGMPESLIVAGLSWENLGAVLLVLALFGFLDMYIILAKYHNELQVEYPPYLLFIDMFVGLLFLYCVELIRNSSNGTELGHAIVVIMIIYALVGVRQFMNYRGLESVDPLLESHGLKKKELVVPMYAALIAVLFFAGMYQALRSKPEPFLLDVEGWSKFAVFTYVAYFVSVHVVKWDIKWRRRP
jgi:hypothetical protein